MVRTKTRLAVVSIDFQNGKFQESSTAAQLYSALRQLVQRMYGLNGVVKIAAAISVVHINPVTRLALIRYSRDSQMQVYDSEVPDDVDPQPGVP